MSTDLEILNRLSKEDMTTLFDPICVRQKSNWSKVGKYHKLDNGYFNADVFLKDMKNRSPKLDTLLKKIAEVDAADEKKYGKKFKHFIFSDLKSGGHGAKMIAAGLLASGWTMGYDAEMKNPPINKENEVDEMDEKDVDEGKAKKANIWGPIEMRSDSELLKTRGDNFYLLSSVAVFDKPISVKMKKEILSKFNSRPENIYGDLARIIIMDSGYKEGIDLFDIKYIHIFEPSVNSADQKQVIGRGTRTCGQKGLDFHPTYGWPLHVFVYDLEIPEELKSSLLGASSAFELYMKSMNINIRLLNFGYDIERTTVLGSVDYELNEVVHNFSINIESEDSIENDKRIVFGGKHSKVDKNKFGEKFEEVKRVIQENYGDYKWSNVKMENLCVEKPQEQESEKNNKAGGAATLLQYTLTQNFIRHYFTPSLPMKGILLYHSVGTGKTCSAIAAATRNFEPADYTILWVTRTTLKNDIWKNMFQQVCNETIRNKIADAAQGPTDNNYTIPDDPNKQKRLLSKSWRIRPLSYKQFSNLVSKQNEYYTRLVKENGEADPLRKTLLIIDEAHKLYGGGDLSSIERPDMVALHESIMKSYTISGNDSVRLLLMTATPITESPMELIQLLNLCKPLDEQMPHTFDSFSEKFLNAEGFFTEKGRANYLDWIAGHVSYLNREKDARQFAQPVIKQIMTPIVSSTEMDKIKQFDKFMLRTTADGKLNELKEKAEKEAAKMEGELSEMDKDRFQYMKKKCDIEPYVSVIPHSKCNKIIQKNIRDLVSEVKTYTKSIRQQIQDIKKEVKNASKSKQKGMEEIRRNIERRPEEFEKYKNSAYFSVRSQCGKRVYSNAELLEHLKDHPRIIKYNKEIKIYEDHIEMMQNRLKIESDAYKLKVKSLKDMLRNSDLSHLERAVIKLILKDSTKTFQKTKKRTAAELREEMEDHTDAIKLLQDRKKEVFKNVKKTMKNMIKIEKKKEKEAKNIEVKLRKTLRKQGELQEEIKDETIRELVDKYEGIIKSELEDVKEKETAKEHQKQRLQEEKQKKKEEEKQRKKEEKQRKQEETRKEKQRIKEEKNRTRKNEKAKYKK